MKKIGIVVKTDKRARKKADLLEHRLRSENISIVRRESTIPDIKKEQDKKKFASSDIECVFVLGGDGTFLSAVRWIGDQSIPILGVKFGAVGFLAETTEEDLVSVAESIIRKNFSTEKRTRLLVSVIRGEKERCREVVLNDVVINKGALARLAYIDTYIDDYYLTTYNGDGLIVSTPTGSTAYSLAAGGPIVHPSVAGILLTPICPFTLTNRPLIVQDEAGIKIRLGRKSSDIMLTFDGQTGLKINEEDTILIKKSPFPVNMISIPGKRYFDILKAKLRWSGGG